MITNSYSLENDCLETKLLILRIPTCCLIVKVEKSPNCCCRMVNKTFQTSKHHKPLHRRLSEEAGHRTLLLNVGKKSYKF